MSKSKTNAQNSGDIGARLGPYVKFAYQAALEGGHRVDMDVVWGLLASHFSNEHVDDHVFHKIYEVKNKAGYQLTAAIGPTDHDDPTEGRLAIQLRLPGSVDADIGIGRETEGPWRVVARGTLSLPVGHPLGELAHADRFLALGKEGEFRDLDEREAERCLMEMARIFERETR